MTRDNLRARLRSLTARITGIGGAEHVLYICTESVTALRREGRHWNYETQFQLRGDALVADAMTTDESRAALVPEAFLQWIERWRGDQFRIIVDSADEEIDVDELPKVGGADRGKVLDRRIRQRFRDASLTTWVAPRGRRGASATAVSGECALLALLRQRNLLQVWIDAAVRAGARIASIESPALLCGDLLGDAGARPTALVIGAHPAGLRQTLVQDGEVRFTRLLPMALPASWDDVHHELEKTVRFLMMSRASLRTRIQTGAFPLYLDTEGIATGAIDATLHLDGDTTLPIIALPRTTRRAPDAGAAAPELGGVWGLLGAHAAGRAGAYAGSELRANWRQGRSIASVWSLALMGLVAAVGANVYVQYLVQESSDPAVERQRTVQIETTRARTSEIALALAVMPVNAREMAGVVNLAERLRARHVDALGALRWIGEAVAPDPALTLNDVSWEPKQTLAAATSPAATVVAPAAPAVAPEGAKEGAGDIGTTLIRIAGVVDTTLPKETANRKVGELLARLRESCGCEGRVVEQPYDPSMEVAYSNSLRTPVEDHPPHFTVEMERPVAVPVAASGDSPAAASAAAGDAPEAGRQHG